MHVVLPQDLLQDLTTKANEWCLSYQEGSGLLIPPYLLESFGPWPVSVWLPDTILLLGLEILLAHTLAISTTAWLLSCCLGVSWK